ncbi:hypothetical protein [Bradyrhizobium symbiodeficiens]|uniref:Uncharacterized protein n=1 Tax=Bradyrhizobium symbiodeficiens TaxID=1404367 RepID=A0A6G9ACJ7_9BRAD|nr:hypothetical protein [Bradyrhizobium symbiodeficiens]QIP10180.1 hypothetical protein HAV00_29810 [Bradyrhizobium symbiodeficiens]
MGVSIFVFDQSAAPEQADYRDWIERESQPAPNADRNRPESSSPCLRKWFDDMRSSFPLIGDAPPDDPHGTQYCFFENVTDAIFASSIAREGVLLAWRLAEKHGLRVLIGDELLAPTAPKDDRDFHVAVLDGRRSNKPGITPNVCFVVFDPDIEHVAPSKARAWALERLGAGLWSKDRAIVAGDRLGPWIDQFASRNLEASISEMRFYRDLIFIRVDRKASSLLISPTMELSHQLGLPFEVYVDLP